jgi:hypothetical protein
MLIENQATIELSEQELEVVAGGADESFVPTKLPSSDIFNKFPEVKYPSSWEVPMPNPFPLSVGYVVAF